MGKKLAGQTKSCATSLQASQLGLMRGLGLLKRGHFVSKWQLDHGVAAGVAWRWRKLRGSAWRRRAGILVW